ncbi:hypothetical protein [Aeromonas fluvialis]|uniref:hypothetical protein n=1 Tax=Aeromonas fluvialis TaxID=591962 RepID=UPI0014310720|nr:hypothetical protein [Aeromonas fluvialis]
MKNENFRQFGAAGHALKIPFNEGITALVAEYNAGNLLARLVEARGARGLG